MNYDTFDIGTLACTVNHNTFYRPDAAKHVNMQYVCDVTLYDSIPFT